MAVEDKYIDTLVAAETRTGGLGVGNGSEVHWLVQTFEVAAADDDGSIYRLFNGVPSTYIPVVGDILCDAITAGTDWDLGLYKPDLGAVVDKDVLMDGQTLATALTRATGNGLGLSAIDPADYGKKLWELAGATITTFPMEYDIALTANTVGSAAGTVTVIMGFANP